MNPEVKRTVFPTNLLIVFGVALAILIFIVFLRNSGKGASIGLGPAVSPDILLLTQPVNSFSGKIDKMSNDSIQVSNELVDTSLIGNVAVGPNGPTNSQPASTPKPKKVSYSVKVPSSAKITRSDQPIPYLFKNNGAPNFQSFPEVKFSDLKVGDLVSITSSSDLRTVADGSFEATNISVRPQSNSIVGQVKQVKGNALTLNGVSNNQAFGFAAQPATPKDYDVTIGNDTEIGRFSSISDPTKPARADRLGLGDIKIGSLLTIYTDQDVTSGSQLKALLIIVQSQAVNPALVAPVPASGSAKTPTAAPRTPPVSP